MTIEKIITPEQVEFETSCGWIVIERFEVDEVTCFADQALPSQDGTYSIPSYPVFISRTALAKRSYFRVRLGEDSTNALFQSTITSLKQELDVQKNLLKSTLERCDLEMKATVMNHANDISVINATVKELERQLKESTNLIYVYEIMMS